MGTNITAINPPPAKDTNYVQKIIDSFNGVDAHDHSSGKGLPVARVASGAIGTSQIADDAVTVDKIADGSITAALLAALSVSTAKIQALAVTRAKLEAVGQQTSSASGTWSNDTTSFTDVTNLSVTITTTGRPVMLLVVSASTTDSGSEGTLGYTSSGVSGGRVFFRFRRDSTTIATTALAGIVSQGGVTTEEKPAALMYLDTPAAGTYTYKLQGRSTTSTAVVAKVVGVKLVAFEL